MRSPMLGEFMGTLILILLGNGVSAGVLLKRSKAENSGWMVVTAGWAFAVLCGIFTALLFGSKDGHINPAITLAFAIENHEFSKLLPFAVAQCAGGFCGAVLVWLFYLPHWKLTGDPDAKSGAFFTSPAIRNYEFEARFVDRSGSWTQPVFGQLPDMGNWSFAGRNDRLRDQPGTRPWPADGACGSAHCREGGL